jgi:hypothetical protein
VAITDDTITKDVRFDGIKWICLFVLTGKYIYTLTIKPDEITENRLYGWRIR